MNIKKMNYEELLDLKNKVDEAFFQKINLQIEEIKKIKINTLEELEETKKLAGKIYESAEKVFLFYYLIGIEKELKKEINRKEESK